MMDTEGAVKFHGRSCAGLAISIRAAEVAGREIGPQFDPNEITRGGQANA